jgi:predicted metalloprotease with PDZ domain
VAHEYFHLWNVKRFRPIELGPFDYDKENYTSLLWVMEGFTSYYDELIMRRAGFMSQEEFVSKMQNTINYVEGSVGSRVQSVAHSSFDAWIKAYRPNENSSNTTMTYYSRGQIIAAVFDLMIIDKYKGKKCLDDFMRYVYVKYAKELKRGITDQEFKQELEKFLEIDLAIFYAKYIDGTEIIPYAEYFSKVGIDVIYSGSKKPSFGASVKQEGGNVVVKTVRSGSSAEMAGISVNDEIIACNGFRVNQGSLESTMNALKENEQVELLLSRDDVLFSVNVKIAAFEKPYFTFTTTKNEDKKALRNYWLR